MKYFCGIDIGASAAKLALVDERGRLVAKALRNSGVDYAAAALACLEDALAAGGLEREQIAYSLSTGYGRDNVPWASSKMTEIACHSRGAWFHFRRALTVIDIGAQDSKMIHLDREGQRTGFKMNRKCAAGTGAFLQEIALRLDLPVSELNGLAERSTKDVSLGSFCTVFAATEILERIRAGQKAEDIVKGAFRSVVKRIQEMDAVSNTPVMTGGVAEHNPYLVKLAEQAFGKNILVPPDPQHMGAFGAALYAMEKEKTHADPGPSRPDN